ncbi:60S ribosomal protein L38 [Zea mays]|uniref:60S ribosomal protein L38 n=2 Tax=Zea mays TaxID=4577 RepID=A0A8J8XDL3_MAIZE|nr:hypothetical protein ZEAMMB73_Zm00001d049726 [Zea mays]PWZ26283.1 60S ribosomal protein L38 [Zea mays]
MASHQPPPNLRSRPTSLGHGGEAGLAYAGAVGEREGKLMICLVMNLLLIQVSLLSKLILSSTPYRLILYSWMTILNYFGNNIPINGSMSGCHREDHPRHRCPSGPFNILGLANDPYQTAILKRRTTSCKTTILQQKNDFSKFDPFIYYELASIDKIVCLYLQIKDFLLTVRRKDARSVKVKRIKDVVKFKLPKWCIA